MMPVADWLKTLGLEQYAAIFTENSVDFRTLKILTDKDLQELGLPFGPRKLLLKALAELSAATLAAPGGERRQLTVLFCDMVGFTALTQSVDPEILRGIIRCYEDACAACIARYEGFVFQLLGDGVVAFFGFPLAHEGEAERAIRAGLDIMAALARLDVPGAGQLKARIGIASGIVVVAAGERGVVGEALNLAARLQTIAQPGSVVVSEQVQRLAAGDFDCEDLGERELKGFVQPIRAYRVQGVRATASRFDAATRMGLHALVGREPETSLLLERWRQVQQHGAGQIVLLSGEAGIGKSRIVGALRERLETSDLQSLRFQCSPFHVNSPFHPFSVYFEQMLDLNHDDAANARLDKLEALVAGKYARPLDDVRFVAAMLSIPHEARYDRPALAPRLAKQETIRVLIDILRAVALARPGLIVFEDLHWADPTTLEVLGRLFDRLGDVSLLVVLTHRPEFAPTWAANSRVTEINLAKLSPAQSRALVMGQVGGKALPPGLIEQIIAKTDGVPLFVEELTKAILESGDLVDEGDRYAYAGDSVSVAIPETLRDSLTARLDRVATVNSIAQAGAVIGREFSHDLIAALDLMSPDKLSDALARLIQSGLIFRQGAGGDAVYTFKHALVQDVAYDSLLKSRRKQLHGKIARLIEERRPQTRAAAPELLAHHYAAAGQAEAAVPYWQKAGELAMRRFAVPEAVTHLRTGLKEIEALPRTAARDLMELAMRAVLGPALVAQLGWAHQEVGQILEPAWMLAEKLAHRASYLPILSALWVHHMTEDQLAQSLKWAERLLLAGAAGGDDSVVIAGHRAASASHYWLGDFTAARRHGDIVQSAYDHQRHWHIAQLTNTDPLTGVGIYSAQYLWMLGYPDQARAASDVKDAHARRRNHPFDLAFALTLGAQVFDFRCEPAELLARTEEALQVSREHGVAILSEILAEISRGIAWLRQGRAAESLVQLEAPIARLKATGHRIWMGYLQATQAEALALSGDAGAAMTLINESVAGMETGQDRAHYAEILRLKGWLLVRRGECDAAERYLRASLAVARAQAAKSWELRSATTLARLLADRGDTAAARALLAPVHDWFTEGFGTRDLVAAKTLLDGLAAPGDVQAH